MNILSKDMWLAKKSNFKTEIVGFIAFLCLYACSPEEFVQNGSDIIKVKKDQVFHYKLKSNLGTGYQWKLVDTLNFVIVSHEAFSNPKVEESTDIEVFKLKSIKTGVDTLTFYYLRPFEEAPDTTKKTKFTQKIETL